MFSKKMRDIRDSLFFRLTFLYALTFMLAALAGFCIFYYRIHAVTMDRIDADLLAEAEAFSGLLAQQGVTPAKDRIADRAESEDPREEFIRIVDLKGNILATTEMSSWASLANRGLMTGFDPQKQKIAFATIDSPEEDHKARMLSAVIGPDMILHLGESLEEADDYLEIFRNLLIMLIVALVLAAAIIGWFLARRALADMQHVTRTAREISGGSYDRRVRIKGQFREIRTLGQTFNQMLDRIQNLLRSMKEINDNIAHDLRSPLARIRGIAEMTLSDDKSIEDYKEMAVSTIEECDSLIGMINTMLDITEAEAGVNGANTETFDVSALVLEACELFRPIADQRRIGMLTEVSPSLPFRGDRKKLQRIVTNILENAIKYTPPRGKIRVSAAATDGKIQIVVNDDGIGISPEDLPHIFERFYRCDRSRSQSGVGLGLSLAKAYTESMRGIINVESALGRGSTFRLQFEP